MSMKPPQVNKQKVKQWIKSLETIAEPNGVLNTIAAELHFAPFDEKNPAENYIEWLLDINTKLNKNTVADRSAYKEHLQAFGEKILDPLLSKLNAKNVAYTEAEYAEIQTISKIYGISINISKALIPQTQAQAEKATPVSASTTAAEKISVPQAPSLGEQALPASAKPVSMATQPKQQQPSAAHKAPSKTNATTNTQQQKGAQVPPLPTTKPPVGKQATKPASGTNTTVTPPSVTASKSTQTAVAKAQTTPSAATTIPKKVAPPAKPPETAKPKSVRGRTAELDPKRSPAKTSTIQAKPVDADPPITREQPQNVSLSARFNSQTTPGTTAQFNLQARAQNVQSESEKLIDQLAPADSDSYKPFTNSTVHKAKVSTTLNIDDKKWEEIVKNIPHSKKEGNNRIVSNDTVIERTQKHLLTATSKVSTDAALKEMAVKFKQALEIAIADGQQMPPCHLDHVNAEQAKIIMAEILPVIATVNKSVMDEIQKQSQSTPPDQTAKKIIEAYNKTQQPEPEPSKTSNLKRS